MNKVSDYPECDRLVAVAPESNRIGDFLDWLNEQGIVLAKWHDEEDDLFPYHENYNSLLARYYDIDLNKVENERREILRRVRMEDPRQEVNE